MRRLVAAVMLCAVSACSIGKDVPVAAKEVERFHAMLDAGQIAEIYRGSAPDMKSTTSEAKLITFLSAVHRKLGTVKSTKQMAWNDQANTGGHFITLDYATVYTGGEAAENFVFKIADGKATLAGYHINSDALIIN